MTWATSPRQRRATSYVGYQGPALRPQAGPQTSGRPEPRRAGPRGQPEPQSRATWPALRPQAGQSPMAESRATVAYRNQGPALRPGSTTDTPRRPEPRSARLVLAQRAGPQLKVLPACSAPVCGRTLLGVGPPCGPPCGATLWGHLVGPPCGPPCVIFDIGNLSTMGNALMLPPLPAV